MTTIRILSDELLSKNWGKLRKYKIDLTRRDQPTGFVRVEAARCGSGSGERGEVADMNILHLRYRIIKKAA